MLTVEYIIMAFGGLLALIGIALFVKMGVQGVSSVKILGVELTLGGSALVVFVLGVVVFLAPLIWGERIRPQGKVDARLAKLFEEWKELPPGPERDSREQEIREIMAKVEGLRGAADTVPVPVLEDRAREKGLIGAGPAGDLARLFAEWRELRDADERKVREDKIRSIAATVEGLREAAHALPVADLERLAREKGLIGRRQPHEPDAPRETPVRRLARLFGEWRELPEGDKRHAKEREIRSIMAELAGLGERAHTLPFERLEALAREKSLIPSEPTDLSKGLARLFGEWRELPEGDERKLREDKIRSIAATVEGLREAAHALPVADLERLAREKGLIP